MRVQQSLQIMVRPDLVSFDITFITDSAIEESRPNIVKFMRQKENSYLKLVHRQTK